jgi:hypothetical protein
MTGAVAAITVTGTIYGAQLKTDQEVKQVCLYPCYMPSSSSYINTLLAHFCNVVSGNT